MNRKVLMAIGAIAGGSGSRRSGDVHRGRLLRALEHYRQLVPAARLHRGGHEVVHNSLSEW